MILKSFNLFQNLTKEKIKKLLNIKPNIKDNQN